MRIIVFMLIAVSGFISEAAAKPCGSKIASILQETGATLLEVRHRRSVFLLDHPATSDVAIFCGTGVSLLIGVKTRSPEPAYFQLMSRAMQILTNVPADEVLATSSSCYRRLLEATETDRDRRVKLTEPSANFEVVCEGMKGGDGDYTLFGISTAPK
jgi:hypothetical protein